jgi:hypothetical protein
MGPFSRYITAARVTGHNFWEASGYSKMHVPKDNYQTNIKTGYISLKSWYQSMGN